MQEELEFLNSLNISSIENIKEDTFDLCKEHFNFISDLEEISIEDLPSVFVIPTSQTTFTYATENQIDSSIALTSQEYFEIIFNKAVFEPELNGISETIN